MKKILAILASFSLATTASASLISCGTIDANEQNNFDKIASNTRTLNGDLSTFESVNGYKKVTYDEFEEMVKNYENMIHDILKDNDEDRELTEDDYNIDYSRYNEEERIISLWVNPDLELGAEGKQQFIIVDSIQSEHHLEIDIDKDDVDKNYVFDQIQKRIDRTTLNRPTKIEEDYTVEEFSLSGVQNKNLGLFKVSAKQSSTLLKGEFNLHLRTHWDTSNYQNTGDSSLANNVKKDVLNGLTDLYSKAELGIDYEIIDNPDESFKINSIGKDPTVVFSFEFKVQKPSNKIDISNNGFTRFIDDENAIESEIRIDVKKALQGSTTKPIFEKIDYKINIPFENERSTKVGIFTVEATQSSKVISGSFNIILYKKIDVISLPFEGDELLWNKTRDNLIEEIDDYYQTPSKDQYIIDEDKKTIKSVDGAYVEIDYSFNLKTNIKKSISSLEIRKYDAAVTTKVDLFKAIADQIDTVEPLVKESLFDEYTIDTTLTYFNGKPSITGEFTIEANENSKLIEGSYKFHITYVLDLSEFPVIGDKDTGDKAKEGIIDKIIEWDPNLTKEEVREKFIDDGKGGWHIESDENADLSFKHKFIIKVSLNDLVDESGFLQFDIDKANLLDIKEVLNNKFNEHGIPNAKEGTDYTIDEIPNLNNELTTVGRYEVKSNPNSSLMTGKLTIRLIKELDVSKYSTQGRLDEGEKNINNILIEARKYMSRNLVEETDKTKGDYIKVLSEDKKTISLNSTETGDVIFKYSFEITKINLFSIDSGRLSIEIIVDEPKKSSRETIEDEVHTTILYLADNNPVEQGKDYEIYINYINDQATELGSFKVSALPGSEVITGSFNISVIHKFSPPLTEYGPKEKAEEYKTKKLDELRRWKPTLTLNDDYKIQEYPDGSFKISSGNDIFIQNLDYNYKVLLDIKFLNYKENAIFKFDLGDPKNTKEFMISTIKAEIEYRIPGVQEGVDYILPDIKEVTIPITGHPEVKYTPGAKKVTSNPDSHLITGEFKIYLFFIDGNKI